MISAAASSFHGGSGSPRNSAVEAMPNTGTSSYVGATLVAG